MLPIRNGRSAGTVPLGKTIPLHGSGVTGQAYAVLVIPPCIPSRVGIPYLTGVLGSHQGPIVPTIDLSPEGGVKWL